MWTSRNFPPKTRTTAVAVVHSLFIPLFLSQFLPHSGSSWSPHKTVHSLRLLTGFHPSLSHPVCPKALSKLQLHGHIFSSLRSHQPLLFQSFHPGLPCSFFLLSLIHICLIKFSFVNHFFLLHLIINFLNITMPRNNHIIPKNKRLR